MTIDNLRASLADRYRIEQELGRGGMATVYLAQDLKHERRVAIKVLRPELAAVIGAERFLREIKTIATLQHPHILGLIDSGEVEGTAYYVMPFVEGESLRDRLQREKQLPITEAVRIASEVAGALDYAHRHDVVHRDIKPENILLHDGQALVADFGIALAVSSAGGTRMTETGMSLGTPHYMSPEQAMGDREISGRSDIYALGCVSYEMLTGDPPFTGSTAQAIVAKMMTERPAAPSRLRDTIPAPVEEAVLTALEKLPADRFATAAEFATALGGAPTGRIPTRAARSVPSPIAPWRSLSLALGFLVLVLAGVSAWALGRTQSQPAPQVFDEALPDSARMDFTGQTPSTPYGSPLNSLDLSGDGRFVVYLMRQGESTALWRRSLVDATAAPVTGTVGGNMPRISPDGSQLAFAAGTSILVLPMAGGPARRVADFEGQVTALEWTAPGRLLMVDLEGYRARRIDTEGGGLDSHRMPRCIDGQWLADEKKLLCSLGGIGRVIDPISGAVWTIRSSDSAGAAAGTIPGSAFRLIDDRYLVYASPEGDVRAAPYDKRSHTIGRSVTMLSGVRLESTGNAQFSINRLGMMVYAPGGNARIGRLVRLAPGGTPQPLPVEPGGYANWDLSRDRQWLATVSQAPGYSELRIHNLRDRQSFLWLKAENMTHPLWSPDGSWLIVRVQNTHRAALLLGSPSAAAAPDTVFASDDASQVPTPMDVNSAHLVIASVGFPAGIVRFDPLARPVHFDTLAQDRLFVMASPDGRRLVMSASEGSRVLMTAFPPAGWERQIAANSVEPLWLSNTEILYRSGVTWHLTHINPATNEIVGPSSVWGSDPRFSDTFGWSNRPSWDGGIIYLQGPEDTGTRYLRVLPHWVSEMRRAVDQANR
ncbi:MAG TPA: protein kinase [Gemmatimonadales bacterium]|nr:protein kinase [Gemmatimonadales bacterium]